MARAYSVFFTGGRELQLRKETLEALTAPAVPAASGFCDECIKGEMRYSLGFFKPGPTLPFGHLQMRLEFGFVSNTSFFRVPRHVRSCLDRSDVSTAPQRCQSRHSAGCQRTVN